MIYIPYSISEKGKKTEEESQRTRGRGKRSGNRSKRPLIGSRGKKACPLGACKRYDLLSLVDLHCVSWISIKQMKNLRGRELRKREKEDDNDAQKEMKEKLKEAKRSRRAFDKESWSIVTHLLS